MKSDLFLKVILKLRCEFLLISRSSGRGDVSESHRHRPHRLRASGGVADLQRGFARHRAGVHVQGRLPRFQDSLPTDQEDLPCREVGREHALLR